jgi:hypothetical protein
VSLYKLITERLWGDLVLLECGHRQITSPKPKARTICGTCNPDDHKRLVDRQQPNRRTTSASTEKP